MEEIRLKMQELVTALFAVDSIWSIVLRGAIWFGIAIVIIVSVDSMSKSGSAVKSVRTNLGFFLLFIVLLGVLLYLLFGFAPTPTGINPEAGG